MDLAEFLRNSGYRRIVLARSGVGHFHAQGMLNEHPVSILLDTGGSNPIVNLPTLQKFNLAAGKLPHQGGGAGAARMDIYRVPDAMLRLEDTVARASALLAMDLSHVNDALARKGPAPIDIVVGVDVFEAQSAITDYPGSSLFLMP